MSRYSRRPGEPHDVVEITDPSGTAFHIGPTTTFREWIGAWLDFGAAGITDVITLPHLPAGDNTIVVMAYRLPKDAEQLADTMAQSLAELVEHKVLSPGNLSLLFQEPHPAPSSNTGRTGTIPSSQEGDEGKINAAIEALIKLCRDCASGL